MTPDELVSQLPDTLEYTGEFGPELVCFVPFIHWLHVQGRLKHRRVISYAGMRPFYYFLDEANYVEKAEKRKYVPSERRPTYWPNRDEISAQPNPFAQFPDYRRVYEGRFGRDFDKPILVIHNKYCDEWDIGPTNFMPIDTLDRMFTLLKQKFQIVYFREGFGSSDLGELGYSGDHNIPHPFDDEALLRRHPDVIVFERFAAAGRSRTNYNELKLTVFADCKNFISSQGGGAHMIAMFSDIVLVILHRAGFELRGAYASGFYRFAANPPPVLLVTWSSLELEEATGIFQYSHDAKDGVILPEAARLIEKFRPERSVDPNHTPTRPTVW
jgi:hypothetical protein